ncbi:MAG: DUF4344 domain-containing metallopeptidase [Pyrinomonadaceae bacterium]
MSKNFSNLLAVLALLFVITACVCQSDRNQETPPTKTKSQTETADTPKNTNAKKPEEAEKKSVKEDKGDFIVEHEDVKDLKYKEFDRQIREGKELEKAAQKLNASLSLPKNIYLRTKVCNKVNAFYDPNDSSITVCYELMEYFYNLFKANGETDQKASAKMSEVVQFVFLHEIAHALIDSYDLPVMANEEDAADRCSSFINIKELDESGANAVISAAEAFRIESKGKVPDKRRMADEHLLKEQRFYNALCMLYGSNMKKYSYIVDQKLLPEERAARCPSDFEKTVESWVKLLEPWRKG